ncbi:hypothetical protein H6504_04235 [Candidatus Woesearchaeota archaeon]|nr:hypothetical protein [Candidatus Woesearchaeota archaeon]
MRLVDIPEDFCDSLCATEYNLDSLIQKYESGLRFDHYLGHLSEAAVEQAFRSLGEKYALKVNPIPHGTLDGDFTFRYTPFGRLTVHAPHRQLAEYDLVAILGDLPIVVEVKVAHWHVDQWKAKGRHKHTIKNALREEFYERRLAPLAKYFNADVGYMVLIGRDIHERYVAPMTKPFVNGFQFAGGRILPFFDSLENFRSEVQSALVNHGKTYTDHF